MTTISKKRKKSMDEEDTNKKALNRLVNSLLGLTPIPSDISRMAVVEESLAYALIALDQNMSHADIVDELEALAVNIIIDKMDQADKRVLHIEVDHVSDSEESEHAVTILCMADTKLSEAVINTMSDFISFDDDDIEGEDDDGEDEEVTIPMMKKPTDYSIN